MTRQVRHVHFREEPCRGLAFPPGTGLRDREGTLAENCKRDLEAMAGGAERDASWPELKGKRVEAARSGRMLFL